MWLVVLLACTLDVPHDAPPVAAAAPPPPAVVSTALVAEPPPSARLQDEQNSVDVFKAVAPATVFVTQSQVVVDRWRMRSAEVPAGTGTGFLWDQQGHVVTNYHVIDGAQSVEVTLYDQSTWPARFVGGDPRKDVAVLQIEAPADKLVPVSRPEAAHQLEVGQKALAIGNPFGLDHTLTVGVISALDRENKGYGGLTIKGMIQTDASINPGNSGGPLLDARGRLIGMNTMIYSPSGSSAGIGFAVPWTTVDRVVTQILTAGKVQQVGIGVSLVDDRIARYNGIRGLVIEDVAPDSPAASAGLQGLRMSRRGVLPGDILVGAAGKPIQSYDDLYGALDGRAPGDKVTFSVQRDDAVREVELTLVELGE
jgi:S1-C subfamily serine protease